MNDGLYEKILQGKEKISIIGLGYVGMPIAVAFAEKVKVIGFDVNNKKIKKYRNGEDPTNEVGDEVIRKTTVEFTNDENKLNEAKFHIVAVPTPVRDDNTPDLTPVISASKLLGKNLNKGSIVVYESTVYPGVTEEICIPVLEECSGLKCGIDFKVGYSPERINPGDKIHRLDTIIKIVSGMDEESKEIIAKVYSLVAKAGVYEAESIKVAEAAKVIENSQRDINIAFMNELAIIFNKLGIDTKEVLKAAGTKWNFLNFTPGLVGGHCIGVDPYYLTYKAEKVGYHSQVILSGRKINDSMGEYIACKIVKQMVKNNLDIRKAKVAIFGLTFKENCPDIRNTKVIDIINELKSYGIEPIIVDPIVDKEEAKKEYDLNVKEKLEEKVDVLVFSVAHDEFKKYKFNDIDKLFKEETKLLFDLKGIFDKKLFLSKNYIYWRL